MPGTTANTMSQEIKDATLDKSHITGVTVTFTPAVIRGKTIGGKSHVISVEEGKLCVDGVAIPIAAWAALDDDQKDMYEGTDLEYEAASSLDPAKLKVNMFEFFANDDVFPDVAGDGSMMELMDAIVIRVASGKVMSNIYTINGYTLAYGKNMIVLPTTDSETSSFRL